MMGGGAVGSGCVCVYVCVCACIHVSVHACMLSRVMKPFLETLLHQLTDTKTKVTTIPLAT